MATTQPSTQESSATLSNVDEAVAGLRARRDEVLQELSQLNSEECRYPAEWARG